jgi:ribose transport system substrate-binding protein
MSATPKRARALGPALAVIGLLLAALALSACGGSSSSSSRSATESESSGGGTKPASSNSEAWCGEEGVTLGIQDGGGLNAWSKESLKQVQEEAAKCPAVEKEIVVNAGFEPQKAVSGLQSMVAQGANAIVLIPDSGVCAEVPAMRQAVQHGASVVAWGADPCGTEGTDYTKYIDWDTVAAGREWAEWVIEQMGGKGKLLYEGGPAGNTVSANTAKGVNEVVEENPGVELVEPISEEQWPVTNWDPAESRKLTASLLAKHPEIDGLINDYGSTAQTAIQAFEAAGRKVPPTATLEANSLACTWKAAKEKGEEFPLLTISSRNWIGRYAVQTAVADASGGEPPAMKNGGIFSLGVYEDSVGGKEPKCDEKFGPETYFSNEMSEKEMNKIALEQ